MKWHREATLSFQDCSPVTSPSRGAKEPPFPLRRTLISHTFQEQVASIRNADLPLFSGNSNFSADLSILFIESDAP